MISIKDQNNSIKFKKVKSPLKAPLESKGFKTMHDMFVMSEKRGKSKSSKNLSVGKKSSHKSISSKKSG